MEEATEVLWDLAKVPSVVHSHLHKTDDGGYTISTVWSQRDLERGETVKFSTTHFVFDDNHGNKKVVKVGSSTELKDE